MKEKSSANRRFVVGMCALVAILAVSCAGTPKPWPRERLEGKKFEFKTFDVEVNRKLNIVTFDCLDTRYHLDILPIEEIAAWAEREYGVIVDTSEFRRLRDEGKLKATVRKDEKGDDEIVLTSWEMAVDYADIGGMASMGLVGALSGTSFVALNWSEYREPVKIMSFRNKVERGKTDQLQILMVLAPLGPHIQVMLRVCEGEPDEKGYRDLVIVASRKIPVKFKKGVPDPEIVEERVRSLPALLAAGEGKD